MTDSPAPLRALNAPAWSLHHWVPLSKAPLPAFVERVIDGDSFVAWARVPLEDYPAYPTIRLAVVDAPEILHPTSPEEAALGAKATAFARLVLEGQQVALIPTAAQKDDRGRWVAAVIYRDARHAQVDFGSELKRRKLTKADVPAFAAATPEERAAWGTV